MEQYEVVIRLILAVAVGGLIGYERSYNNRPAGFRTHILVCVGSAIVSIIQIEMTQETIALILKNPVLEESLNVDIGRLGAQVITGVGFLGAGTIIREKGLVKGLTTAASLWVVACIGLAIGLGMYFISIVSTMGVFIALVILKKVEEKLITRSNKMNLEIEYLDDTDFIQELQKYFLAKNIRVSNIRFLEQKNNDSSVKSKANSKTIYTVEFPIHIKDTSIIQDLCKKDGIIKVKIV